MQDGERITMMCASVSCQMAAREQPTHAVRQERCAALLRSIAVTRKGVAHGIGDCLFTRSSAVTKKPQLP
ncbi:hypothetical protein [Xanthomonas arboricola]|uniref:hypothetical protein n=1 Tax=Xanthomonas arboricola TaxID=56448 RepID=UPI00129002C2|nr:hypothetical protein [Xanthomonas arboricola]